MPGFKGLSKLPHTAHRIDSQFADKPILVHRLALLAAREPRGLRPHLFAVLEDHVTMPIKRLHAGQDFAVVANGYQDLRVAPHSGLEDRERAGRELCRIIHQ